MKTLCQFKNTESVEAFCKIGASQFFRENKYHSHFIAVEFYLWNEFFKQGARQLVGFTGGVLPGTNSEGKPNWDNRRLNSQRLKKKLSQMYPEMECRCWTLGLVMDEKTKHIFYQGNELSCPHFGIRAVATEELESHRYLWVESVVLEAVFLVSGWDRW